MSRAEKEENPLPSAGVRGNSWLEDDGEEDCEEGDGDGYGAPHDIVSPTAPRMFMHGKDWTAPWELEEGGVDGPLGIYGPTHSRAAYSRTAAVGAGGGMGLAGAGSTAAEGGVVVMGSRGAASTRPMFDQRGVVAMSSAEHMTDYYSQRRGRFEVESSLSPNRGRAEDIRREEHRLDAAHRDIEHPDQDQAASNTSPPSPGPWMAGGGDSVQQKPFVRPPLWHGPGSQRRMLQKSPSVGPQQQQPTRQPTISSPSKERRSQLMIKMWMKMVRKAMMQLGVNGGLGRYITIVCNGVQHLTYEKTLRKYPGTLLTDMLASEDAKKKRSGTFQLPDRHHVAFAEILNIYRTEAICWRHPLVSKERWFHELKHFRINAAAQSGLEQAGLIMELDRAITKFNQHPKEEVVVDDDADDINTDSRAGIDFYLHKLVKSPDSGAGLVFSTISMTLILLSVTLVCIETLPEVWADRDVVRIFSQIDFGIVLFFSFDYGGRMKLVEPRKRFRWMFKPFNVIDALTIVPSYITFFGEAAGKGQTFNSLKFFRVLRVLRIFKLGRYLPGLQVLVRTAVGCRSELGLLFFCLFVFAILFSSLIYYAEMEVTDPYHKPFSSIPHTLWWAIVTMTSTGYGDMVPITALGKLFGTAAAVSGVILIALPISVISTTFSAEFKLFTDKVKAREQRLQANLAKTKNLLSDMETRRMYMTEAQRLAEVEKGNSGSGHIERSDSGGDDEGPDMTPGHKARAQEEAEELARKIIGGSKNPAKLARNRAGSMSQMT